MTTKDTEFFGMSDDDFAKLSPSEVENEGATAPSATSEDEPVVTTPETEPVVEEKTAAELAAEAEGEDEPVVTDPPSLGSDDPADAAKAEDGKDEADKGAAAKEPAKKEGEPAKTAEPEKPADGGKDPKVKADPVDPAKKDAKDPEKVADKPVQHLSAQQSPEQLASFFDKVMAPIKANGKTIRLTSPEDAIRLMQMGAGYGKKIQDMQPHMKALRMLEKNGVLDENKLSYLIDLDKKNPEAIKKLIKDSGIDPLDLNMDEVKYRPTNHSVSDTEMNFTDALRDVQSQEGGTAFIQHINKDWDQSSKDNLFKEPTILTALQEQRAAGIYDVITAEIDRQKMLGIMRPNTPFLEAYKLAGDHLVAEKQASQPKTPAAQAQEPAAPVQSKVLATRTATPKPAASNSDKVKAAASPAAHRKPAKEVVNPLAMSDDDFVRDFKF